MSSPDNEAILTIGYGVDTSATPRQNFRNRRKLNVTEFTVPCSEGTYPTDFGDITVLYVTKDKHDQPVRIGLEGNLLKGKSHGRRHGHRMPRFEDEMEVQLSGKTRSGSQALSKRETIFVSAGRVNS